MPAGAKPSDPGSPSPATRLVDDLAAGGEVIDQGEFTIDLAAAADKLEAFAYADRGRFLVPILEGLAGLGARRVVIDTRLGDLSIAAGGIEVEDPSALLLDLSAQLEGLGDDPRGRACQRLAVGLDMVIGGSPTTVVRVRCSDRSSSVSALYRHRAAPELSDPVGSEESENVLDIHIDRSWKSGLEGESDELHRLRIAVRSAPFEVVLDGELISRNEPQWLDTWEGSGPGYRIRAGFEREDADGSVIELWSFGVCIQRRRSEALGFRTIIELDAPRRDLSRMNLVRDEVFEAAMVHAEQIRVDAFRRLELLDEAWTPLDRPPAWPMARVDRVLKRPPRGDTSERGTVERNEPATARMLMEWTPGLSLLWGGAFLLGYVFALTGVVLLGFGLEAWLENDGLDLLAWGAGALALTGGLALVMWFVGRLGLREPKRLLHIRDHGTRTLAKVVGVSAEGRVEWEFVDGQGIRRQGRSQPRVLDEAKLWVGAEAIVIYYDPGDPDSSCWAADVGPPRA